MISLNPPFRFLRRLVMFGATLLMTAAAGYVMFDVLGSDGLTGFEIAIVVLFTINFLWIALSFATAVAGLVLRVFDLDPVTLRPNRPVALPAQLAKKTVIVVPVYNENPHQVFARVRAVYESLRAIGHDKNFDFFILSDTRDPDIWIAEELGWGELRRALKIKAKIFYRRREKNTEKKSGNLMEFCENWGSAYENMLVFDADSVMSAHAIVTMTALMEQNPNVGLIQSPPQPTGQSTLFARILQFISSVHGPTMTAGLCFWQLGSGNYWGHNAIIRMKAFIECCGLPVLPGKPPLGGPILSHDFVEAALLRRAGWECWLVPQLTGSWEELPPNVIDYAARDRRWCQGNLQHIRVVLGEKIRPISRLHLFMGVMAYVSSPLWLLLLIASTLTAWQEAANEHSFFSGTATLFPSWPIDRAGDMLMLLSITLGMLIVPKFLSTFLLMARGSTARLYGGRIKLLTSAIIELIFSALLAPTMMLLHSLFVVTNLTGTSVAWEAQNRDAAGVPWGASWSAHLPHVLIGAVWGTLAYIFNPGFFWWMTPVILGLVLSPFLTHWGSLAVFGKSVRAFGLFLTPEEVDRPKELVRAKELMQVGEPDRDEGLLKILTDPLASALHAALIPDTAPTQRISVEVSILYEKLSRLGPESLSREEKILLLSYPVKPLDQIMAPRGV